MDFEISTGIFLPGSEQRRQTSTGDRQHSGASFHIRSVLRQEKGTLQKDLQHYIERIAPVRGKPRVHRKSKNLPAPSQRHWA